MRPASITRSLVPLFAAVALCAARSAPSLAQAPCAITGPAAVCGGAVELCGPDGDYEWAWTGPGGFTASTRCVNVSVPGDYALRVFDRLNGLWSAPCTHTLGTGSPPSCGISAPSSPCAGQPAQLCGPTGDFDYRWTGPAGFAATTPCVSVSTAGSYSLVVTDRATGCASASCLHDLQFVPCGSQPSCPRRAHFWSRQCGGGAGADFDAGPLASVAKCVDSRSALFAWTDAARGFCGTLGHSTEMNARQRAKRHYAALLANLCAGELGLATRDGRSVSLDPGAQLEWGGGTVTVADWTAATDARLVRLEGASLHRREVRAAYREIAETARRVNAGRGIGPVCAKTEDAPPEDESALEAADDAAAAAEETIELGRPAPNPFANSTAFAYSVPAEGGDVELGVYDVAGRLVRELVHERQAPGPHRVSWDGRLADGAPARSGAYLLRVRIGDRAVEARVLLLR